MAARRTSFYFSGEAVAALEAIRRRTRFESGADVIRLAVLTYSQILEFVDTGCRIAVIDKNGQRFPYSPYRPFDYPGLVALDTDHDPDDASPKNFFFSGDVVIKLHQIRARGGVRTNSDAIRAALAAYGELSGVIAAGDEVIVRRRDDTEFSFDPDAPYAPQLAVLATGLRTAEALLQPH